MKSETKTIRGDAYLTVHIDRELLESLEELLDPALDARDYIDKQIAERLKDSDPGRNL